MERRLGMRGQVDSPVLLQVDGLLHQCRAIDISTRGLVVHRTRSLQARRPRLLYWLELPLGADRAIRTLARPVWTRGPLQAMRYVGVDGVDQLEIAELVDRVHRGGAVLH